MGVSTKFICIYFKEELKNNNYNLLSDLFISMLGANIEIDKLDKIMIVRFSEDYDTDFSEIAAIINTEMYLSCRLFESGNIYKKELVDSYISYVVSLRDIIENISTIYLNQDDLVLLNLSNNLIKEIILKDYYEKDEMLSVVKCYLDCNMNISQAASSLYMHRNTVTNKIDRFIEDTGYNVKQFKKAMVIYLLINKNCA